MQRNSTFDSVAENYDATFTHSAVGKAQRQAVYQYLLSTLPAAPCRILEINCGTGEDAVVFAQMGHQVLATDVSEKMLERTKQKAHATGLNIETGLWDLHEPFPFGEETFDIIFSNFGGLNCLSAQTHLQLAHTLHGLLKPGGKCIVVVMGKFCLMESMYFLLKGRFSKMFRRNGSTSVPVPLQSGEIVETYYYTPVEIKKYFQVMHAEVTRPVGTLTPPGYITAGNAFTGMLLKLLIRADRMFTHSIFARCSDHFYIQFVKR